MNDAFKVGDAVRWCKGQGRVVGVIEREQYVDEAMAHRWRALGRGVVVLSDHGELFHFRDATCSLRHVS